LIIAFCPSRQPYSRGWRTLGGLLVQGQANAVKRLRVAVSSCDGGVTSIDPVGIRVELPSNDFTGS